MARLVRARTPGIALSLHDDVRMCVTGAVFVVTSIRVGGLAARLHDERVSLEAGVVGQETVGAGGFAMGVRNIPAMMRYAGEIARHAPDAWVVTFTNPVGIVSAS
jgi:6-phospho-beta-glucosidase